MRLRLPIALAALLGANAALGGCGNDAPSAQDCLASCAGCCQGSICMLGTAANACGLKGQSCSLCAMGQSCQQGSCVAVDSCLNCTSGCCLGGICQPGTLPGACGANGQSCRTCNQGERCNQGACELNVPNPECTPYNCKGCCLDNRCITDVNKQRCGVDGSPCSACVGKRECRSGACSFPDGQTFSVCVQRVIVNCQQSGRCDDNGPDLAISLIRSGDLWGRQLTAELSNVAVNEGLAEGRWASDCPLGGMSYADLNSTGILAEIYDVDVTVDAQLAECVLTFDDRDIDSGKSWLVKDCDSVIPELEVSVRAD